RNLTEWRGDEALRKSRRQEGTARPVDRASGEPSGDRGVDPGSLSRKSLWPRARTTSGFRLLVDEFPRTGDGIGWSPRRGLGSLARRKRDDYEAPAQRSKGPHTRATLTASSLVSVGRTLSRS